MVSEIRRLHAELSLTEAIARSEANHLQELVEKRRMIADGLAEIAAASDMWDSYLDEVDDAIATAQVRIEILVRLRDVLRERIDALEE